MQNPFPGMNPYLEQTELWHQVHNRLIVAIADELTPKIAPKYRVSIEERIYTTVDDILLVGIADVGVSKRNNLGNNSGNSQNLTAIKINEPTKVKLPISEEVIERFLEIKATQSREVVTVIEILSPKNKLSKEGRLIYENKRQKILNSASHLIEIDLLRAGKSLPILGANKTDYRILVSRSYQRPEADLYSFDLPQPIPLFPVPLYGEETEPIIDLQTLLNEIYERARFDLAIDYSQSLKPALSSQQQNWIREILQV